MRTGPFSKAEVIDRLNSSFIPVYAVNEDYREHGAAPQAEKDECLAIYREALGKGFSAGSVHVYVVDPQGHVIGTRHVADAAKSDELIRFMDDITTQLGTKAGERIITPKPQSAAPDCTEHPLVLHLVTRQIRGGGSWDGTAEDWVVFEPRDVKRLLGKLQNVGDSCEPPAPLAERLLTHVYPVTENNDTSKNEILEQEFRLTLLSKNTSSARARIDGRLVMRHDFYFKPDGNTVKTNVIGYLDWEPSTGQVQSFRLVTDGASYGGGEFAVAVRSE